jgi:uncharacterized protein
MKNALLLLSLIFVSSFHAQFETAKEVPNPKSVGKSYVSNPDEILTANTVQQIDEYLSELEESDGFQVAIVCVNSIGQNVPKDFATDLASLWGIGNRGKDDGLLILLVKDQKRIEFETGYGTESILPDNLTQQIQQEVMLPYFKQNNYDLGMLSGVRGICNVLRGNGLESNPEEQRLIDEEKARLYEKKATERDRNVLIGIGAWHILGVAIFLIALLIIRYKTDPYKKFNIIKNFGVWIWAILFPITHIFLVFLSKKLMERYRNQVRFSGRTNHLMHKLTEQEEDEFLTLGQQAEEIVKSVDYDVWVTESHDDFCILSYRPIFTKYTPCPKCRYRTYYKVYDKITISPTYSSAGQGEKKYTCENTNCKHTDHTKYSIARLRKSSRTSGGAWIGSGGSGFSGGGSWGGGGSFGGGSFGGGGSGSSW